MFYRLALTSGLTLASLIAISQATLAESVEINFSGTVLPQASFSTPTLGKIETTISGGYSKSQKNFGLVIPTKISVQTSTPTSLSVSSPQFISGSNPDPRGTKYTTALRIGSTTLNNIDNQSASLPVGQTNLIINTSIERPEAFMPGTYTYSTVLTLTAQ